MCRSLRMALSWVVVLLAVGALGPLGEAAPTREQDARHAVSGWLELSGRPLKAVMSRDIQSVEAFKNDEEEVLYYVVSLNPSGFVVVSGDDLIEPIIAFSPTGTYDPDPDSPMVVLLDNDLPHRLKHVQALETQAQQASPTLSPSSQPSRSKSKWTQFMAQADPEATFAAADEPIEIAGISTINDIRVDVLMQSRWNQSTEGGNNCYNYYTPNNYVCGCVATALAQMMRFYQHPTTSVGTATYDITVDTVADTQSLRGGDGSGGPYDWANMVLDPGASTTLTERQAIGALTADCGATVNMGYSSSGSGAVMTKTADSLRDVYDYDNAIGTYEPDGLVGNGLNDMVNPNLDAGLPVMLGISGDGGHAIICDGYGYNASTPYHHLNMGWGGYDDAWYNLPTVDTSSYAFNIVDECVYNVFITGTGELISGRVVDPVGTPQSGVTVTADDGGTEYTDTTDSNGIYAIRVPSATSFTVRCPGAASRGVTTGTSVDAYKGAVGNVWGEDFTVASGPELFYSETVFTESSSNDGSIANSITITAYDDTFTGVNGTDVGGNVVVGNLPSGLTAAFIKDSDTQLTVSLTGNASSHRSQVNDLSFAFQDAAFTGGDASGINNSSRSDLVIAFGDVLLAEDFEAGSGLPSGWSQQQLSGSSATWTIQTGGTISGGSHPAAAHSGANNVTLCDQDAADDITRLYTPAFDCLGYTNLTLTFWHTQEIWPGDQDELNVYYSTNGGTDWGLLAGYTDSVATWTERSLDLPATGTNCVIAFAGNAKWGYGVCIDDVEVNGAYIDPAGETNAPPSITLIAPTDGAMVMPGANLPIRAVSSDSDGTVTNILFYRDAVNLIDTSSTVPTATVTMVDVAMCVSCDLIAVAVDNDGAATTSAVITVIVDGDDDGLPDQWEDDHGLSTTNANGSSDSDGDGATDYDEYVGGTSPDDPTSTLAILDVAVTNASDHVFTFESVTDRLYTIEWSISPSSVVWSTLVPEASGTGGPMHITDTNGTSPRFYRIRVRQP